MGAEPFRGSVAVARGLVTAGCLRGPRYRRLFPDIYLDASVPITPRVRARAAALLVEPCGGVAAGYSAAELLGASCGPWHAPAEVLGPSRVRSRAGLIPWRGDPDGSGICDGVRVTSPLQTAWDLARRLDLVEAVVAVDALAAAGRKRPVFVPHPADAPAPRSVIARSRERRRCPGFDPAELLRRRSDLPGARGARRLDRVVALADPRAGSPPETRLRLLLVLAGLPAPAVQYPLVDALGHEFVRFDLAYPEALLAIEYDGEEHDDALDRRRDLRTSALGWHTLRLLRGDLTVTPDATVTIVRTLLISRTRLLGTDGHITAVRS